MLLHVFYRANPNPGPNEFENSLRFFKIFHPMLLKSSFTAFDLSKRPACAVLAHVLLFLCSAVAHRPRVRELKQGGKEPILSQCAPCAASSEQ